MLGPLLQQVLWLGEAVLLQLESVSSRQKVPAQQEAVVLSLAQLRVPRLRVHLERSLACQGQALKQQRLLELDQV